MTLEEAIIYLSQRKRRLIEDLQDPPGLRVYDKHRVRVEEIDVALDVLRRVQP
jgi:hypothetical protein